MDKIIISDTSCLISLSNIGLLHIIRDLYSEIMVTPEVKAEYGDALPDWVIVIQVKDKVRQADIEHRLDRGEASSIALALEIPNSTLIIDEIKGRNIAKSLNIEIIGTIGILLLASNKGLIKDVIGVMLKLVDKGFRVSDKLLDKIIEKHERK